MGVGVILQKTTYTTNMLQQAGGGGGNLEVFAVIKDLQVEEAAECTLTITGKGGKGGNVDNDGYDGQESSVKCNTDTRTFSVPGGKGGRREHRLDLQLVPEYSNWRERRTVC